MLQVRLFGQALVQHKGQKPITLPLRAQELLFYLLCHRTQIHLREELTTNLWSDASPAHAKKYFRQTLWQLQTAIDSQSDGSAGSIFSVDGSWIQLNLESTLWFDIEQFEQDFQLTRDVAGHHLNDQQAQTLKAAVDLYRGELLVGWYQDWCMIERERLRSMYLAVLDKLIDYCITHLQIETGIDFGMRLLRQEIARERTHRRLIRLYYLAGDRTAALRQFEQCVQVLAKELDVEPSQRTLALFKQVRSDNGTDEMLGVTYNPEKPKSQDDLAVKILAELKEVRSNLWCLRQDIKAIEQTLKSES